jgi:hypothetical protein
MEFITNRYEHKYKHRSCVSWYRFIPKVKCGKVSLRGYLNKEKDEKKRKRKKKKKFVQVVSS